MALVFALGIPCSFLVIVLAHRHRLNPEPLTLIAQTLRERSAGEQLPTAEAKALAFVAATLLNASRQLKTQAMALHATALADQATKTQQDDMERQAAEEVRRAGRQRNWSWSAARVPSLRQALRVLHREIEVASEWTDFLPSHADAVKALGESLAIVQRNLAVHSRSSDPDIRDLGFLVDACKSSTCRVT